MRYGCPPQVRIDAGVAMPREMLGRSGHPFFLITLNRRSPELGNGMGILAEGAHADNRVARIVVDVEARREVHVHAERTQFARPDLRHPVSILCAARCSKRHIARNAADAFMIDSCDHAALLINRDQKRKRLAARSELLQGCRQLGKLRQRLHVPAEIADATHLKLFDQYAGMLIRRQCVEAAYKHLSYLLL
ncbi:Uncharacterised protein [Actinobacillus pleuropneumoniae]|nr:Uncharacterised protein [Actinobacillus pleuropneumoniae]